MEIGKGGPGSQVYMHYQAMNHKLTREALEKYVVQQRHGNPIEIKQMAKKR